MGVDANRFDNVVRTLAQRRSRRDTFLALALTGLGLTHGSESVTAGPGCKDVGKKCKKAKDCCSNACKGKKGKKRCKAHDTGGCAPGTIPFACDGTNAPCTTSAGLSGNCGTTTGNAGYCFSNLLDVTCTNDKECQEEYGPRAACVTCPTMAEGALCAVVEPSDI